MTTANTPYDPRGTLARAEPRDTATVGTASVSEQVQGLLKRLDAAWVALIDSYAGVPDSQLIEPGVVDASTPTAITRSTPWPSAHGGNDRRHDSAGSAIVRSTANMVNLEDDAARGIPPATVAGTVRQPGPDDQLRPHPPRRARHDSPGQRCGRIARIWSVPSAGRVPDLRTAVRHLRRNA
jgi:hypothetical protein